MFIPLKGLIIFNSEIMEILTKKSQSKPNFLLFEDCNFHHETEQVYCRNGLHRMMEHRELKETIVV